MIDYSKFEEKATICYPLLNVITFGPPDDVKHECWLLLSKKLSVKIVDENNELPNDEAINSLIKLFEKQ